MQRLTTLLVILALGVGSYLITRAEAGDGDKPSAPKPTDADGPRGEGSRGAASGTPAAPKPETNDKRFHAALLAAAQVYKGYGRVDDEARWAPWLCRMPMPARVRYSASADPKTHGHKLYYLFAKDRKGYVSGDTKQPHPVGQTIVKEAWKPAEIAKPADGDKRPPASNAKKEAPGRQGLQLAGAKDAVVVHDEFVSDGVQPTGPMEKPAPKGQRVKARAVVVNVTEKDGKRYRASTVAGLYVMLKLDPKTEGTDQGWVYGTLSPDGKTVTSAGRVASCMGCHTQGTHDRLFGLPRAK